MGWIASGVRVQGIEYKEVLLLPFLFLQGQRSEVTALFSCTFCVALTVFAIFSPKPNCSTHINTSECYFLFLCTRFISPEEKVSLECRASHRHSNVLEGTDS